MLQNFQIAVRRGGLDFFPSLLLVSSIFLRERWLELHGHLTPSCDLEDRSHSWRWKRQKEPDTLRTSWSMTPTLNCLTPGLFHGGKSTLFKPPLLYIFYYVQPNIILPDTPNCRFFKSFKSIHFSPSLLPLPYFRSPMLFVSIAATAY